MNFHGRISICRELNKPDEISLTVEENGKNFESELSSRQQLMARRASTFPDLLKLPERRSRTTSERAEEGDQVMYILFKTYFKVFQNLRNSSEYQNSKVKLSRYLE